MAVLIPQWGKLHHYGINYSSAKEMDSYTNFIKKQGNKQRKIKCLWGHKRRRHIWTWPIKVSLYWSFLFPSMQRLRSAIKPQASVRRDSPDFKLRLQPSPHIASHNKPPPTELDVAAASLFAKFTEMQEKKKLKTHCLASTEHWRLTNAPRFKKIPARLHVWRFNWGLFDPPPMEKFA